MSDTPITRELYDAFQRVELDRWDALIAEDVLVNSPAGFGIRGLAVLKDWAAAFARLGRQIDLVDEHLALDTDGTGRGFITFTLHWKHTDDFFGLAPTGREGTSVETMLLTVERHRIVRIDVADNSLDLVIYMWDRNWAHPHNVRPEPLVVGVDRHV
jgi:ketosteroid isomerase-like protein